MRPVLYIGNRRFSTWSLRPWLVLKKAGIAFDETLIPLYNSETRKAVSAISPGGTVPALHTRNAVVWDSLAIAEWAAEQVPGLWPAHQGLRARARAAVAMMHSGFPALREACPMDLCRAPSAIALTDRARIDIAAVQALWHEVKCVDGPWLFGDWSIADAFYTPVAARFHAYAIPLHAGAQDYCDTLLADEHYRDWHAAAQAETFPNPYDKTI
ncbi:glutathione S-transferase family protein [Maricaulis sp.]|uniref:glutathione S-transferase family protein n=1 Tax=Maricaulis sp. TaxID=1486257 RepID=UPI0025C0D426|nr:glutathione S-transferase family protein [Maricaulis sp.]